MEVYRDSLEHLQEELARLDLLLRRAVIIARVAPTPKIPQELRGVVVSDEEVDAVLDANDILGDRWRRQNAARSQLDQIGRKLEEHRAEIDERRKATRQAGLDPALSRLADRFHLSPAEVDLLLISLAPEMEPRYETLYAYLQEDATRKRPSVDLATNLICRSIEEKTFARRLLVSDAPLIKYRLLTLHEEPHDRQPTFLRRFLKLDDSVVGFLLNKLIHVNTPPRSASVAPINKLSLPQDTRTQLQNMVQTIDEHDTSDIPVIHLVSSAASPAWDVADSICAALHCNSLRLTLPQLQTDPAAAFRDATLGSAIPVIDTAATRDSATESSFWSALNGNTFPIILLGPSFSLATIPPNAQPSRVEIPPADYQKRLDVWQQSLTGAPAAADAPQLADTFQFEPPVIRQTARLAKTNTSLKGAKANTVSKDDVLEAGRTLSTPNLSRFAIAITPKYKWADLVLPKDKLLQLHDVESRVRYRQLVHREWGFGNKMSRGKGLNVLFTGPSGTGKTMAAEVLAGALSLTLYQIDLSSVISKYIGETEQHLSAIFREAESGQTLLFFDEAEALFGKRTEVKDAHDRYANIEVNYLLQRIEQFEGIVVLATNLHRNLDEAFLRRLSGVIEFPIPDEAGRQQIWEKHFPTEAPRERIDFHFLAKNFKLTGGQIRNIVISAAYAAAPEDTAIQMSHIIPAIKTEYQKQGKLAMESEFGKYLNLTKPKPKPESVQEAAQ